LLKTLLEFGEFRPRTVRNRVKDEREEKLDALAREELEKHRQAKEVELAVLEEQYQNCLSDLGAGHEGAREHERHQAWLASVRERQCKETRKRGNQGRDSPMFKNYS
jgi:hypothetical protein